MFNETLTISLVESMKARKNFHFSLRLTIKNVFFCLQSEVVQQTWLLICFNHCLYEVFLLATNDNLEESINWKVSKFLTILIQKQQNRQFESVNVVAEEISRRHIVIFVLTYRTKTLHRLEKYDFQYVNYIAKGAFLAINWIKGREGAKDLLQCAREIANKLHGIYIFMTVPIYGRNCNFWRPFLFAKLREIVICNRFIVNCNNRALSHVVNIEYLTSIWRQKLKI